MLWKCEHMYWNMVSVLFKNDDVQSNILKYHVVLNKEIKFKTIQFFLGKSKLTKILFPVVFHNKLVFVLSGHFELTF